MSCRNFIKKLFCRHNYTKNVGFSYIECEKCGKIKYDPNKANEFISKYVQKMVSAGHWKDKEGYK